MTAIWEHTKANYKSQRVSLVAYRKLWVEKFILILMGGTEKTKMATGHEYLILLRGKCKSYIYSKGATIKLIFSTTKKWDEELLLVYL